MDNKRWSWGWAWTHNQAASDSMLSLQGPFLVEDSFLVRAEVVAPFRVPVSGDRYVYAWATFWPSSDLSRVEIGEYVCQIAPGLFGIPQPATAYTASIHLPDGNLRLVQMSDIHLPQVTLSLTSHVFEPIDVPITFSTPCRLVTGVGFEEGLTSDLFKEAQGGGRAAVSVIRQELL